MNAPPPPSERLLTIDWLRGLVMILMTVDHASDAFNAGRLIVDSVRSYHPGTALPPDQFLTRWITHICAPTFVFLAGTAMALSIEKQRRAGKTDAQIDGFTLKRGLFIALLDPLWMYWAFGSEAVVLQVMYAIGTSFMCMALLRRLPTRWLVVSGLVLLLGSEALGDLSIALFGGPTPPATFLLTCGHYHGLSVWYPTLPWLSAMLLGFALGRRLSRGTPLSDGALAGFALGSLSLFAVLRAFKGYGNMHLQREDGTIVQWLHVSKYPPSITYMALELGLSGALFLLFTRLSRRPGAASSWWAVVLTLLGQTALFYYVLHVHLMELVAHALGVKRHFGLGVTYAAAVVTVAVLLPLCGWYRRYKRAHPEGWTRYL